MREESRPASPFSFVFVVLVLALSLVAIASARAQSPAENARVFVQGLSDQATALLADSNLTAQERAERFRGLLNDFFASSAIGKWVLGRYWRQATEQQQKEYLELFEDYIVYGHVKRFSAYSGEQLKVVRAVSNSENSITVFSQFIRPDGSNPINVDWRVAPKGKRFLITDVVVEGTSLSQTLRSDFASTIHQKGGKIAGLLEVLREKVSLLKAELGITA
jgi:phospholipid transport system substrate-binding protein